MMRLLRVQSQHLTFLTPSCSFYCHSISISLHLYIHNSLPSLPWPVKAFELAEQLTELGKASEVGSDHTIDFCKAVVFWFRTSDYHQTYFMITGESLDSVTVSLQFARLVLLSSYIGVTHQERWLLSLDARLEEEMASWFVGNMWN